MDVRLAHQRPAMPAPADVVDEEEIFGKPFDARITPKAAVSEFFSGQGVNGFEATHYLFFLKQDSLRIAECELRIAPRHG